MKDVEELQRLFGEFVKDPDDLLKPVEKASLQERIFAIVMPKGTATVVDRTLLEEVGRSVRRPWFLESLIPFPIMNCLVDEKMPETVAAVFSYLGRDSRIIAACGTVEFGIHDFGGRMLYRSFGNIIGELFAAAFSLPTDRSWIDEFVQARCPLQVNGQQVVGSRIFYSVKQE